MIEDKTEEVRDLERKIMRLKGEIDIEISFKNLDEKLTKDRIKVFKGCKTLTKEGCSFSELESQRLEQRKKEADSKIESIKREIEEAEKALEIAKEKQKIILKQQNLIEKVKDMDIRKISDAF